MNSSFWKCFRYGLNIWNLPNPSQAQPVAEKSAIQLFVVTKDPAGPELGVRNRIPAELCISPPAGPWPSHIPVWALVYPSVRRQDLALMFPSAHPSSPYLSQSPVFSVEMSSLLEMTNQRGEEELAPLMGGLGVWVGDLWPV